LKDKDNKNAKADIYFLRSFCSEGSNISTEEIDNIITKDNNYFKAGYPEAILKFMNK